MDTESLKKAQRWRKTFAKHLALISDHTERFIMALRRLRARILHRYKNELT